jgi:hypothetical protein
MNSGASIAAIASDALDGMRNMAPPKLNCGNKF